MLIRAPAILCASRPHGETGAIVRLLTADHGLAAAYVAGARGRELRPLLIPGNLLEVEVRARTASQLPSARLELVSSRGPWLSEPLPSAGISWACALTAASLPEGHSYPPLYQGLGALLDAICHAPSARGWARALAGYEVLLLREVGYGATPAPPPEEAWPDLLLRLERQGKAIGNRLLAERAGDVMGARAILLDRLRRISETG
ncbi:MAG: DNA recombination protein RecO [Novosphingobium sp. 32-60-15]|uniref:DNA repair protein RecO n=1 Tax=unclassified Novosphingobium TaxID=2644732 RepID=UPI000BD63284|nr:MULTISPECIES: recombination protein O N-terminal domain-containing protein [unclassified Novosphingobium]OYX61744.1 MAG: DNA recombination protein RecO [Novosphingobium sp. 32-60-15]